MLEQVTLDEISRVNRARSLAWHDGVVWTGADWSNAMCGEAGEAANFVKKLRRIETGIMDSAKREVPRELLLDGLADEIADTVLYADLLADNYNISTVAAIIRKFNRTSELAGFTHRIGE